MARPVIPTNEPATIINGVPDEYGGHDDRNILVKAKDKIVHAVKGDPTPGEKMECYAKKQEHIAENVDKFDKKIQKEEAKAEKYEKHHAKHAEKAANLEAEKLAKLEQAKGFAERVEDQANRMEIDQAAANTKKTCQAQAACTRIQQTRPVVIEKQIYQQ